MKIKVVLPKQKPGTLLNNTTARLMSGLKQSPTGSAYVAFIKKCEWRRLLIRKSSWGKFLEL